MADAAPERKIHDRLSPDLHRRLRVRCAELDTPIQDYGVELLESELRGTADGNRSDPSRRGRKRGRRDG
jgi:hypothetical protein